MKWQVVEHEGRRVRVATVRQGRDVWVGYPGGAALVSPARHAAAEGVVDDAVVAPMTAKVIQLCCKPGDAVKKGDLLVALEAMKMEYRLVAPKDGAVEAVLCQEGQLVDLGVTLIKLST